MVKLYNKEMNQFLGTLTEEQLQFLIDQLEEESADDTDYYINRETLEMFEQAGADSGLMNILRQAMGEKDEMEIRWSKD